MQPETAQVRDERGRWTAYPGALRWPSSAAIAALIPGGLEILLLFFSSPLTFLILCSSLIQRCDLSPVGSFCGLHVDAPNDSSVSTFEVLQEQNQGAALPGNIWVVFYSCDSSTSS